MVDAIEFLRAQGNSIVGELAQVNRSLKRHPQEHHIRGASRVQEWAVGSHIRNVVSIVYMLLDDPAEPCVCFLRRCGRQRHWPDRSDQELRELAETCFLRVPDSELAQLADVREPSDAKSMKTALRLCHELSLIHI